MLSEQKIQQITELTEGWRRVSGNAGQGFFDYNHFKNLCSKTFRLLFECRNMKPIPNEFEELLFTINYVAYQSRDGISKEYDAAKLIAAQFVIQFSGIWLTPDTGLPRKIFVAKDKHSRRHNIDINSFDMSAMIL